MRTLKDFPQQRGRRRRRRDRARCSALRRIIAGFSRVRPSSSWAHGTACWRPAKQPPIFMSRLATQATIQRVGKGPVDVKIAGVVALPNADSMFQAIGVSKNLAPQAPPDNVLLMPMQQWQAIFGPQSSARPDTVRTEIHVRFDRSILPPDPSAAF